MVYERMHGNGSGLVPEYAVPRLRSARASRFGVGYVATTLIVLAGALFATGTVDGVALARPGGGGPPPPGGPGGGDVIIGRSLPLLNQAKNP